MPIIPLPTASRPLADAPSPVLNRERLPTVDNRGVMQAVGELGGAMRQPLVDGAALAAPYEALGAVGRALADGGGVLGALAIKRREAESDLQIAEADGEMDSAGAAFEKWKLETNAEPASWDAEWEKRLGVLQQRFGDRENLNAGAREQIGLRFTRYAGQSRADVMAGAAKETFSRARSTFSATISNATEAQDQARFDEALKTGAERGYFFPHEIESARQNFVDVGERKRKEAEAEAARQEYDLHTANINEDPEGWLKANAQPWADKPKEWRALKNDADRRKREKATDELGAISDEIWIGGIKTMEEIEALRLPPEREAAAKFALIKTGELRAELARHGKVKDYYGKLWGEVSEYDSSADPKREGFVELRQKIRLLVGDEDGGFLQQVLYAKASGRKPALQPDQLVMQNLSDSLDDMYNARTGQIPWEKLEEQKDDKGRTIIGEDGRPKTKWVEDAKAKERARNELTRIRQKLRDKAQINPELFKDLDKARFELFQLLNDGRQGGALEAFESMFNPLLPPLPTK